MISILVVKAVAAMQGRDELERHRRALIAQLGDHLPRGIRLRKTACRAGDIARVIGQEIG